jgi:hypothetical protein
MKPLTLHSWPWDYINVPFVGRFLSQVKRGPVEAAGEEDVEKAGSIGKIVRITGFGEVPYSQIKPNHLVPGFMGKIIMGYELVVFSRGCPVKMRG